MSYKTILTVIQSEREADRLLDGSIAIANRFGAHLIGFHPELMPLTYGMAAGFPDAELLRDSSERAAKTTKEIAGKFRARLEDEKLSHAWASMDSSPGDSSAGALRLARSADLVIAAQPDPEAEAPEADLLLSDSGRPVLVLPREKPVDAAMKRIVVGWNSSKQASRAVFDALPFLLNAEHVDVLVVDPEERRPGTVQQGEGISAALARHGVKPNLITEDRRNRSVEEAIVAHCSRAEADLLVLGAYGHSWLREFLFGGVTRGVLDKAPVATLMSH